MGGDHLLEKVSDKLGIKEGETTEDGMFSLERLECNAACDFAPVMMVNWEFMDNMTPELAEKLLDDLAEGRPVHSTRGPELTGWRDTMRVLAGFPDGKADDGPTAGPASQLGNRIAKEKGWKAPGAPAADETAKEEK
jgi:NADH-quinone oxidoreductase subunit E